MSIAERIQEHITRNHGFATEIEPDLKSLGTA